jgi:hypothetical protein
MKIGDLVKVYNFTHKARHSGRLSGETNVGAHFIGLIIKGSSIEHGLVAWARVLRSFDGEVDLYNVARIEVINES